MHAVEMADLLAQIAEMRETLLHGDAEWSARDAELSNESGRLLIKGFLFATNAWNELPSYPSEFSAAAKI